jgi:hypothetical protein
MGDSSSLEGDKLCFIGCRVQVSSLASWRLVVVAESNLKVTKPSRAGLTSLVAEDRPQSFYGGQADALSNRFEA